MGEGAAGAAETPAINKRPEERRGREASRAQGADATDLLLCYRAHSVAREAGTGRLRCRCLYPAIRSVAEDQRDLPALLRSGAQPPPPPEVWVEPELPRGNFFSSFPPPAGEEKEEEGKPPATAAAGANARGLRVGAARRGGGGLAP